MFNWHDFWTVIGIGVAIIGAGGILFLSMYMADKLWEHGAEDAVGAFVLLALIGLAIYAGFAGIA